MRITGGKAKGITLNSPKGSATRPAADAIREALYSSIAELVPGCRLLDLFAGTGAYGLEALSRGAARIRFVESDRKAVASIRENLQRVRKSSDLETAETEIFQGNVFKVRSLNTQDWDIMIADPPYADIPSLESKLFDMAERLLVPAGLLILEHPANLSLTSDNWVEIKRLGKKRGRGPAVSIWRRS
ncbi:MAG: RsmD family RNA methyltransferase [Opitutales bacterium]|jgi:16S rRNA (guanine966-N2)-methyltransferase|nr:RsmD family RNA methyltransferase [Opitutales bacterium]